MMVTVNRRIAVVGVAAAVTVLVSACGGGGSGGSNGPADRPTATTDADAAPTTSAPIDPAPSTSATTSTTRDAPVESTAPEPPAAAPLTGALVVVDPGHNGANGAHPGEIDRLVDAGGFQKACNTTGTAEGGVSESSVNWALAQRLRTLLEAQGAEVVTTRSSDDGWGPCIDQRGLLTQEVGADLLVSLHVDGAPSSANGFHVIAPGPGPTVTPPRAAASARLAEQVRDALVAQGLAPATYVGTDGLVTRTDLGTLNRAVTPAVMLEAGNLHHPGDFATLTTADGQDRVARAVAAAVSAFLTADP